MNEPKPTTKPDTDLAPAEDWPEIPATCQAAWDRVHARVGHDTRVYRGLRFLLAGYTYRECAQHSGLADSRPIRDYVTKLGIHDDVASTDRAIANHRRIRHGAQEILLKRIESGELDDEKAGTLGIVMGIADDKVRAHEAKQGNTNNALDALQAIGQRIAEAGVNLNISISPVAAYKPSQNQDQPTNETNTDTIEAETLEPE